MGRYLRLRLGHIVPSGRNPRTLAWVVEAGLSMFKEWRGRRTHADIYLIPLFSTRLPLERPVFWNLKTFRSITLIFSARE